MFHIDAFKVQSNKKILKGCPAIAYNILICIIITLRKYIFCEFLSVKTISHNKYNTLQRLNS